jgi:hypothetical protein
MIPNEPNPASAAGATGSGGVCFGGEQFPDRSPSRSKTQVKKCGGHGLGAERVPLSGSAGGSYAGDLTVPILGRDLVVEAKARANGFARLYSWLEGRDVLIIKADRRDAIVVLPLRLAADIAIAAERGKP